MNKHNVRVVTVKIGRYKVKTYSYGEKGDVLFLLNGGLDCHATICAIRFFLCLMQVIAR